MPSCQGKDMIACHAKYAHACNALHDLCCWEPVTWMQDRQGRRCAGGLFRTGWGDRSVWSASASSRADGVTLATWQPGKVWPQMRLPTIMRAIESICPHSLQQIMGANASGRTGSAVTTAREACEPAPGTKSLGLSGGGKQCATAGHHHRPAMHEIEEQPQQPLFFSEFFPFHQFA